MASHFPPHFISGNTHLTVPPNERRSSHRQPNAVASSSKHSATTDKSIISSPSIIEEKTKRKIRSDRPPRAGDAANFVALHKAALVKNGGNPYPGPDSSYVVDIIRNLTEECNKHELKIQTLQTSIQHHLSEYPNLASRFQAFDDKANSIHDTLMDSPTDNKPPTSSSAPGHQSSFSPVSAGRGTTSPSPSIPSTPSRQSLKDAQTRTTAESQLKDLKEIVEQAEKSLESVKDGLDQKVKTLEKAKVVFAREPEIVNAIDTQIAARRAEIARMKNAQYTQNIIMFIVMICIVSVIFGLASLYFYRHYGCLLSESVPALYRHLKLYVKK